MAEAQIGVLIDYENVGLSPILSLFDQLSDLGRIIIKRAYADWSVERNKRDNVKALATDFLVYSALAEIFGRQTGFNRGLGGSMHVFFPGFGIYPNNAIVGGSADISVGASLFKKINQKLPKLILEIMNLSHLL